VLKKLAEDYDPTDKDLAYKTLENARRDQKLLTGIFYIEPQTPSFNDLLNTVDAPLASLQDAQLRPSREALHKVMASL
jgi:2-oxoglutarate ferredoxin oxidoreductase subunit beta